MGNKESSVLLCTEFRQPELYLSLFFNLSRHSITKITMDWAPTQGKASQDYNEIGGQFSSF
jgi:hypothetical protein